MIKSYSSYYDLELNRPTERINKLKLKLVLLQFPDGLKHYSEKAVDSLRKITNSMKIVLGTGIYKLP